MTPAHEDAARIALGPDPDERAIGNRATRGRDVFGALLVWAALLAALGAAVVWWVG